MWAKSWLGGDSVSADHKKIGKTECINCHRELIKHSVMHAPAEGCDACHEYTENEQKAQVNFTIKGNELCFTCHPEKQEAFKKKNAKHPPVEDDCTNCHDAHSTDNPRMLKMPLGELCVTCHPDKQEEFEKKKFSHAPVRELGCVVCHDAHAADYKPLLKAEPNTLCLACHKYNPNERTYGPDEKTKIFPDTSIPAAYPGKARKVVLGSNGRGHPFIGHPVGGIADPAHKDKQLTCMSCHNPHAGNFRQMFQNDIRGQELCLGCHK